MANQLKMDKVQAIFTLHEVGWSNRRIARELGIHRTTVAGYLQTASELMEETENNRQDHEN